MLFLIDVVVFLLALQIEYVYVIFLEEVESFVVKNGITLLQFAQIRDIICIRFINYAG